MSSSAIRDSSSTSKGPSRFYTLSLISYATEEEIWGLLQHAKHWCYAFHDKDVKEDGTPKEPHWHIVCTFAREKSCAWARKQIASATGQNTLAQPIQHDLADTVEYLWHQNDSDKFQYSRDIVKWDDVTYWAHRLGESESTPNPNDEFMDDLLAVNGFSVELMARRYGRDFIKNVRAYMEFRRLVFAERSGACADRIVHENCYDKGERAHYESLR